MISEKNKAGTSKNSAGFELVNGSETKNLELRLVITGGGTGGHVFPGVAIAEEMDALCRLRCLWIGTGRPVGKKALEQKDWGYKILHVRPLKGGGAVNILQSLVHLPLAIMKAAAVLKRFKPDVVLGVGGYVSGPVLAAARILRIPTAIHEQNLLPGLANKMAAKFVDRVFISFEASRPYFSNKSIECAGNPVRKDILEQAASPTDEPGNGSVHILVLGGSQGASGLNRLVSSALKILFQSGQKFSVIHQTGVQDFQEMQAFYKDAGMDVAVNEFINEMGIAYSWADLIICRAGATTLAEITAVGKPVICIPYPHSADGHQGLNARAIYEAGAGLYFEEGDVGAVRLASEIEKLMSSPETLADMTVNARKLGRPEAAAMIARSIIKLSHKNNDGEYSINATRGETIHGHV